jgi:hypothetical protein
VPVWRNEVLEQAISQAMRVKSCIQFFLNISTYQLLAIHAIGSPHHRNSL